MSTVRSGYPGRMARYLGTMFPIPLHLGFSALLYSAIALFVRHVHAGSAPLVSWWSALGVADVFGLFLILRLMDELKDRDLDERLFPERPLPSGLVREGDIRGSLVAAGAVYLVMNAARPDLRVAACVLLGFATLMFLHFFAKRALRASLPLTLATHQPVIPLMLLQGVVVAAAANGLALGALRWDLVAAFVLLLWMPFLGWEIARKIRAPDQETDYVTYSKLFGVRRAVAAAAAVQGFAAAAALLLWARLSWSPVYVAVVVVAYAFVLVEHVRFARHPTADHARLKRDAQGLLLVLAALQVLELGVLS